VFRSFKRGVSDTATLKSAKSVPGLSDWTIALSRERQIKMATIDGGSAVIVLVVEDETLVRLLANDILTEAGYRVLEARDGQEALTVLEVHEGISALLTDVTMPNLDGLALAKIVQERWPHIGIVVSSGMPRPSVLPNGARFISKPYTPEAVIQELEVAMRDTAHIETGAAPVALASIANLRAGQMHGAGGLAQPLAEPED
jgi:CheY-like chemotaxis protein